jgi:hypothetical protein
VHRRIGSPRLSLEELAPLFAAGGESAESKFMECCWCLWNANGVELAEPFVAADVLWLRGNVRVRSPTAIGGTLISTFVQAEAGNMFRSKRLNPHLKELKMNMIAISVVALFAAVISASAQTNPPISTRTINLTAEQYHVIKETVLKDATASPSSGSSTIKIGERVPATVNLKTFPPELSEKISALKTRTFYVYNGKIVIVDPKDNSVADIIE